MVEFRNASGRPLSSDKWLEAHHAAKLEERLKFAQRIAAAEPAIVADLGCGTGLWLDLLHATLPKECQLIGIDSDQKALEKAYNRSNAWHRPISFVKGNLDDKDFEIPFASVYLCFNVFGYVSNLDSLLERIRRAGKEKSTTMVRQYDGSMMRFGPLSQRDRHKIDGALMAGIESSLQFRHYEIDRTLSAINRCSYLSKTVEFENFCKISPFSANLEEYANNTIEWMSEIIDVQSAQILRKWLAQSRKSKDCYVLETDLISVLS